MLDVLELSRSITYMGRTLYRRSSAQKLVLCASVYGTQY